MVWLGLNLKIVRPTQTMFKGFLVIFEKTFYRNSYTPYSAYSASLLFHSAVFSRCRCEVSEI